jgi:hypothetical protein
MKGHAWTVECSLEQNKRAPQNEYIITYRVISIGHPLPRSLWCYLIHHVWCCVHKLLFGVFFCCRNAPAPPVDSAMVNVISVFQKKNRGQV